MQLLLELADEYSELEMGLELQEVFENTMVQ
jgi:hypothetical protein